MKATLSTGLNASLLQEQAAVITVSQTASVLRSSITNYIRKLIYVHSVLDCDIAAQPIHLSFVWFANQYIRQDVPDLSCAGRAVAKRPFLKFDIPL